MIILAIETSCDETAAAVVEDGHVVHSNIVSSQVEIHRKYGGVVPELACRKHIENIGPVVEEALSRAGLQISALDAFAVTRGPGLVGALIVGIAAAKAMAYSLAKPLIAVNHLEGHIYASFIDGPRPRSPFVALVVSGGHTELYLVMGHGWYNLLGRTRDDAAGESFDKVAKMLGLGYPGGPIIDDMAKRGDPAAISFPRAYLEKGSYDFSFSGLKTAVRNYLTTADKGLLEKGEGLEGRAIPDIVASFQEAVVDVLVEKAIEAARVESAKALVLTGGVAANSRLRAKIRGATEKEGLELFVPRPDYCTDNAAMIACAAYYRFIWEKEEGLDRSTLFDLDAEPNLDLKSWGDEL